VRHVARRPRQHQHGQGRAHQESLGGPRRGREAEEQHGDRVGEVAHRRHADQLAAARGHPAKG